MLGCFTRHLMAARSLNAKGNYSECLPLNHSYVRIKYSSVFGSCQRGERESVAVYINYALHDFFFLDLKLKHIRRVNVGQMVSNDNLKIIRSYH